MKKVFLGGTCNGSLWRNGVMSELDNYEIDYFNPVVEDWTPEDMEIELNERENSDYCLYVITPKMTGVYSIAEVVDDSNKRTEKTLFVVIPEDDGEVFTNAQLKSLESVKNMVTINGAYVFDDLKSMTLWLSFQ